MKPNDFTDITEARARDLLKKKGIFLAYVRTGNAKQHLYAVDSFFVEFIDYSDDTYDVFAYYDSPRLDKFLRKIDLKDYL